MTDSSKNPNNQQLASFRKEIDAIDDQLVALLKERTQIVHQVGVLKRTTNDKDCYIRSGREAHMHRDVYERFIEGGFHPEAALAIWRNIITASTHMEKPMHVAAPSALHRLVDNYFGNYIPCDDWQHTIPEAATILFAPFPNSDNAPFWQQILSAKKPWSIFSYAPLISDNTTPQALLLACIDAEPSGDDVSYFAGGIPPEDGTQLSHGIWCVNGYKTIHEGATFLGAHATPILRNIAMHGQEAARAISPQSGTKD